MPMFKRSGMPQKMNNLTVLGLDPGIDRLGWACVSGHSRTDFQCIAAGIITTQKENSSAARLTELYDDLVTLIHTYKPHIVLAEELFFAKNVKTAMTVSEVRGIIKLAVQQAQVDYAEINPKTVKKRVTGYGNANKQQIRFVVQQLFAFTEMPKPDDVADAIAIAYIGLLEHLPLI